jgi:hypothetical protein
MYIKLIMSNSAYQCQTQCPCLCSCQDRENHVDETQTQTQTQTQTRAPVKNEGVKLPVKNGSPRTVIAWPRPRTFAEEEERDNSHVPDPVSKRDVHFDLD